MKQKLKIILFGLAFSLLILEIALIQANTSGKNPAPKRNFTSGQVLGTSTEESLQSPRSNTLYLAAPQEGLANISAGAYLVYNLKTNQDILAKNDNKKLGIASLTKLLTGLVAYKNLNLEGYVKISTNDVIDIAPSLNLKPGDFVKNLDLFNAMLVGSSNDAAKTLSNETAAVFKQNFTELMNTEAINLNMENSHFSNPLGFDSQFNYSTAQDLKKLINETQKLGAFSDLSRYTFYKFKDASLKTSYQIQTTNKLLAEHPEIEAIKTGFTQNSLGSMATKINIGGQTFVVIVLDSAFREADTLKLEDILKNILPGKNP